MPSKQPGSRYSTIATKAWKHGGVAVEANHAGIAHKVDQALPIVDVTNASLVAAAQTIAIGEDVVIDMDGVHEVPVSQLPSGAVVGTRLWINPSAAVGAPLLDATASGAVKYGVVDAIDTVSGRAAVNLSQRSSF